MYYTALSNLLNNNDKEVLIVGSIGNILATIIRHLKGLNTYITSTKQIRTSVITNWLKQYGLRKHKY